MPSQGAAHLSAHLCCGWQRPQALVDLAQQALKLLPRELGLVCQLRDRALGLGSSLAPLQRAPYQATETSLAVFSAGRSMDKSTIRWPYYLRAGAWTSRQQGGRTSCKHFLQAGAWTRRRQGGQVPRVCSAHFTSSTRASLTAAPGRCASCRHVPSPSTGWVSSTCEGSIQ